MRFFRAVYTAFEIEGRVNMKRTVEAPLDEYGPAALLEEKQPVNETALLSEAALAEDWNRPEEDAAWSYLQPA